MPLVSHVNKPRSLQTLLDSLIAVLMYHKHNSQCLTLSISNESLQCCPLTLDVAAELHDDDQRGSFFTAWGEEVDRSQRDYDHQLDCMSSLSKISHVFVLKVSRRPSANARKIQRKGIRFYTM